MVVALCLSFREVSFAIGPRGCGGSQWWCDVGVETGKFHNLRLDVRLRAWLRIGGWLDWSWTWRAPELALEADWCLEVPPILREAVRQSIIRELVPTAFQQFLPKPPVVSWQAIYGEVVKIVEEAPPSVEVRGDRITITGIQPLTTPEAGETQRLQVWMRWWYDEEVQRTYHSIHGGTEVAVPRAGLGTVEEMRETSRRALAQAQALREPPLSFCADCPGRFRPEDLFIGKKSGAPLCEGCLDRRVARGAAKKPEEF